MRPCAAFLVVLSSAFAVHAARPVKDRAGAAVVTDVDDWALPPFYAQTAWPAVHRDARNSNFAPIFASTLNRVKWTALDGAATLLAPSIGPEGNLYVTTGQGPGTSHLHAFDRDGQWLWSSAPMTDAADLDSFAVVSAPIIDCDGDVYVSDSNQLWAFHTDGGVKWVAALPDEESPCISSIITPDGFVGGITIRGKVVLFNRADGGAAVPVLELPGGDGLPAVATPAGLWSGGLMDPQIVNRVFNSFTGRQVEVANTPAIHPETGRMFITAAGTTPEDGVLYGIDRVQGELEIAFQTPIGPGSGTSPSLSPDGGQVYAVGGDRTLIAIDAHSGEVVWRASGAAAYAAPAVGEDGTIYTGGREVLLALRPEDGSTKWAVNYDALAASFLPARHAGFFFPTGLPVARTNSVVTVSGNRVWVALTLGYEFRGSEGEPLMQQPCLTVLASIAAADGALTGFTLLRDTNEGLVSMGEDGGIYVSHAALLSSIFYYGVNPLLPRIWETPGPPAAGITALAPISFKEHVLGGLRWGMDLTAQTAAGLAAGRVPEALALLQRCRTQLHATARTLAQDAGGEIGEPLVDLAREKVLSARERLANAAALAESQPGEATVSIAEAADLLEQAQAMLSAATAHLDISPGACPNGLARQPALLQRVELAVPGTQALDVATIQSNSAWIARLDGAGESVRLRAPRLRLIVRDEDISAPGPAEICECLPNGPDGRPDRIFSVDAAELVRRLELDSAAAYARVPLSLWFQRADGSWLESRDCVLIGAE